MRVLGIETSCDETGIALVEGEGDATPRLLAQALHSQVEMHADYGGVVPELASRDHIRRVLPLTREVLRAAGAELDSIDVIAYTRGPGLAGALLVGAGVASSLAAALGKPALGVHHLEGHLLSPFLSADPPEFPFVALLVSGGHTQLLEVRDVGAYTLLGDTIDDAAGEAFDKVAKLLGFSYPGGPVIDMLAPHGDPHAVPFTLAKMKGNTLDFSFSGLKTAVLRWFEARDMADEVAARRALLATNLSPSVEDWLRVTPRATLDLLASFQSTVIEELLRRAMRSAEEIGARSLIVSGGVACNTGLRRAAVDAHLPYPAFFPTPALSTDNAAMIAAAAFPKLAREEFADQTLKAQANLALA